MTQGEAKILSETYFNRALIYILMALVAVFIFQDLTFRWVVGVIWGVSSALNLYKSYQFERMSI
jgi:hypothetical protein